MSGQSWVRLWAGATTDPKWQTIARKSGQPRALVIALFTHMMLLANEADERGSVADMDIEDAASALDCDEEQVAAIVAAMDGRVTEGGKLSGWDKRQPLREESDANERGAMTPAERKRNQRDRERNGEKPSNVTHSHARSRSVTQCHAPEAEAEAEAEAETPTLETLERDQRYVPGKPPAVSRPAQPDLAVADATRMRCCRAMVDAGFPAERLNATHPKLTALVEAGATPEEFSGVTAEALQAGKLSLGWILATMAGRRDDASKISLRRGAMPTAPPRSTPGTRTAEAAARWLESSQPQNEVAA